MNIQVSSAKLTTEAGKDISRDKAIAYAKAEVQNAIDLFELEPISAEILLYTEGSSNDPVQKIDVKICLPGAVINQSNHSRHITRAIDKAMPELRRQLKRYKSKKIDKCRKASRGVKDAERREAERLENEE